MQVVGTSSQSAVVTDICDLIPGFNVVSPHLVASWPYLELGSFRFPLLLLVLLFPKNVTRNIPIVALRDRSGGIFSGKKNEVQEPPLFLLSHCDPRVCGPGAG